MMTVSTSGRCGARDREVPVATREIQRPKNQEEGCPSVDAVREAHDTRSGRDTATGNPREPRNWIGTIATHTPCRSLPVLGHVTPTVARNPGSAYPNVEVPPLSFKIGVT